MSKAKILVLGLNPAWQKILLFDSFKPGGINRASSVCFCAAGKGVNFVRAAKTWAKAEAAAIQFAGGHAGELLLKSLNEEKLASITIPSPSSTRTCTTIVSATEPRMTELIEPSGFIDEQTYMFFLERVSSALKEFKALAVCGTCPPGVPDSCYADVVSLARAQGVKIFVDSVVSSAKTLPLICDGMLKVNLDELQGITGKTSPDDALRACLERYGMRYVAASDGPRQARLAAREGVWTFSLPALDNVKNPLGAGDTCSAVTFSELLSGTSPDDAFAFGLAAASASCLDERCAVFSKQKAMEIRALISVKFHPQV